MRPSGSRRRPWYERQGLQLSERFLWDGYEMANNEKSENTNTKDDEVNALRAAAEQGNAEALYKLGNELLYGKGLPKNEDEVPNGSVSPLSRGIFNH